MVKVRYLGLWTCQFKRNHLLVADAGLVARTLLQQVHHLFLLSCNLCLALCPLALQPIHLCMTAPVMLSAGPWYETSYSQLRMLLAGSSTLHLDAG